MLYLELAIVTDPDRHQRPAVDVGTWRSSRRGRQGSQALVEKGVSGSRRALALAADPGKFLSTVQIGITLIGVLSGAFSGATLGQRLTHWLLETGLSPSTRRRHRRRPRRRRHHLCFADRRRARAEADRAARSRSDRGEGRAGDGSDGEDSRCRWCGCSIAPAKCCCGSSASAAKPKARSARMKSGRCRGS